MIYALRFSFAQEIALKNGHFQNRTDALARFNDFCQDLVDSLSGEAEYYGTTEGVLLAEEAHERGYETESWVLDAGEAPHERDWIGQEASLEMTAYFKSEASAERARAWLAGEFALEHEPVVETQEEQDWNATWKAAFQGIEVSPTLRVLPPWHDDWLRFHDAHDAAEHAHAAFKHGIIAINPGAGFGTGTHETTQMCLGVLDECAAGAADRSTALAGRTVLDFGSGSGILGITAALMGARVFCVEVDKLANENATENAKLNGLSVEGPDAQVQILEAIPAELMNGQVDILLANILRPILLQFAPQIKSCLKPRSELILSGLIESDLDLVIRAYQEGGAKFEIKRYEKNEWRALWCRRGQSQ